MLVLLGDALIRGGVVQTLLLAPWPLLLLWGVYVGVFASHLVVDAEALTIQNFLRRTRLTWPAVADLDLGYQLTVTAVDGRRIACYGGPVTGRPSRAARRAAAGHPDAGGRELDVLQDAWEAGRTGEAAPVITRSWDVPALLALLVLVAWAVIAVLIVA